VSGRMAFSGSLSAIAQAKRLRDNEEKMRLGGMQAYDTAPVSKSKFDVWFDGIYGYSHYSKTQSSGGFGLINMGADYILRPGLLVGITAQFDQMNEKSASLGYLVKGNGWMAGPYAAARLSKHLFLDGRLMWGQSDNQVTPLMTYTDTFKTDRWLAAARLTGRWTSGNWSFSPSAEIIHFEDKSREYVDSNGFTISSQQVKIGRVIFGPEVSYTFKDVGGMTLKPHVALKGLWDFDKTALTPLGGTGAPLTSGQSLHGRFEAGVTMTGKSGLSLDVQANFDGIGSSDVRSTSGKATLRIPLN
jgi:outer membrane autotransporter protein